MRQAGLEGRCKKRWRKTTVADPDAEAARDLIQRHFGPCAEIDRRYVGDITYIATWEGWAYLATVIDLASRRVVGWALADHMRTELVDRRPRPWPSPTGHHSDGVIFHSDRGCQGGFERSSQHLDDGGVARWESTRQQKATWAMRGKMLLAGAAAGLAAGSGPAVLGRDRQGLSSEEAASAVGVSSPVGSRWFREAGGMRPVSLAPLSGRYLSFAEREEIAILKAKGCGVREIARQTRPFARRRSAGSCAGMRPPGRSRRVIGPSMPSGTLIGGPRDPRWPSWLPTRSCATTSRIGCLD